MEFLITLGKILLLFHTIEAIPSEMVGPGVFVEKMLLPLAKPPQCNGSVVSCNPNSQYRNFDGTCNNLNQPSWGSPNSKYLRLLPASYFDGIMVPRRDQQSNPLPNARKIRTTAFPTGTATNEKWTINTLIWGQFLAHDMSLFKEREKEPVCCVNNQVVPGPACLSISVPPEDSTMGAAGIRCLNFSRTLTDRDMNCNPTGPVQQLNTVTGYADLSNVYGSSRKEADSLRTFENGEMKTEKRRGVIYAPREEDVSKYCKCNARGDDVCYKTGDSRSNQNPELAIMQTMFIRFHNKIAKRLSELNKHWNDEKLFQESRRINIAIFQKINHYEWLPIFLGRTNLINKGIIYPNSTGYVSDYNSSIPVATSNEHAHAAFRFFHTNIAGSLMLMDSNRTMTSSFRLRDRFFKPSIMELPSNMEQLTMGMMTQHFEETDNIQVEDITDGLFACGKPFGLDLIAADIQRGRDHGLRPYNEYRVFCGFPAANSFDDYKDFIPAEKVELLKSLYVHHNDVDLYVGAALESLNITGAQCGPTLQCIMNDQFLRIRLGDRFWFEHPQAGFTLDQLAQIRNMTIARFVCINADAIENIQVKAFNIIKSTNLVTPCNDTNTIPDFDISAWKELKN